MKLFRRGWPRKGWLAGQFEKWAAIHMNFDQTEAHLIRYMTAGYIFNELNVSIFIFPSKFLFAHGAKSFQSCTYFLLS